MAKNANHVALGESALSYYDPSLGLKVLPGQAVELPKNWKQSKKTSKAIKAGHLDLVSKGDLEDYTVVEFTDHRVGAMAPDGNDVKKTEEEEEEDDVELTVEGLKADNNKDALIQMAIEAGSEYSEEDLDGMNKTEIAQEIIDLQE